MTKNKISRLYFCLIIFFLGYSQAGHAKALGEMLGNGGDGVVCEQQEKTTVELLDFVEAQTLIPKWTLDLGAPDLSVADKVEIALSRLEKFSPRRAAFYRIFAAKVLRDNLFTRNQLDEIDDSKHLRVVIPPNCHVEQAALQLEDLSRPAGKKVLFQKNLWQNMTNDHRAGLVLHEVFYAEALIWGHTDSIDARELTAMVSSSLFEKMSLRDYIGLQFRAMYDGYEINGRLYTHSSPTSVEEVMPQVDEHGHLLHGRLFSGCWLESFAGIACSNSGFIQESKTQRWNPFPLRFEKRRGRGVAR